MKKINAFSFCAALVLLMFLIGCVKNNPSSSIQFLFSMQSDSATTRIPTTVGTESVTWTGAIANVSKFKLNAKKDGSAIEVVAAGLSNINLFAISPATASVNVANGTYTDIGLHVLMTKTSTTAFPLVLKGVFTTKSGVNIPIEYDFNEDADIVASTSKLVIDGKSNILASLTLHLNKLLANVSAQEIDQTTRTNNTILINSTTNTALYAKIKADLLLSGGSNYVPTIK